MIPKKSYEKVLERENTLQEKYIFQNNLISLLLSGIVYHFTQISIGLEKSIEVVFVLWKIEG